jgi:hypothetical protein
MRWLPDGSFLYKENGKLFWRSLNFTSHPMPTLNVHYAKGVFYYTFPGGIMEYIPTTEIYRVVACGKLELQSITYIGDTVLLMCTDRILTTRGVKVPIFGHTIHEYNSKYLITYTCADVQYTFNVFTLPDFNLIHTRNLQKNGPKPNDEAVLKQRFKIINDEIIQLGGQFIRVSETSETVETVETVETGEARRTGGAECSASGNRYEQVVHGVVSRCKIGGKPFCTSAELGGGSAKNDITCVYGGKEIGIEVKVFNTPDWMQCSIRYDNGVWKGSPNSKIPDGSRRIFDKLLSGLVIFNNEKPPFVGNDITHEEWLAIKSRNDKWADTYIDIPDDTIRKLYSAKGCYYIQLSGGYGVYHLGEDVCGFGVPVFEPLQQLRIRIKVHTRCSARGYCNLSVTASCQPKNIRHYPQSQYTLDGGGKLPLIFDSSEVSSKNDNL